MNMKLLYVEDDRINRVVLRKLLLPYAHTDLAASGEDAVSMGRETAYDAFLIDIHLGDPNMDGIKTMDLLKEQGHHKNAVFIALTAYALKEDEQRFLAAGFDFHHPKPVKVDKLLQEIGLQATQNP